MALDERCPLVADEGRELAWIVEVFRRVDRPPPDGLVTLTRRLVTEPVGKLAVGKQVDQFLGDTALSSVD